MSCRLDDCLKARYEENVRRHCGHRLVFADEASRRNEDNAAEPGAAIVRVRAVLVQDRITLMQSTSA